MQKAFTLALNAAAALAAIDFRGVSVEPVYDSVMSETTFSDDDFDLTFNWGSAELKAEGGSAYILAAAFQVGGVDVPENTNISTSATITAEDGTSESWTCSVNWTKPARSELGEDEAEGGIAKTAADATVTPTITNDPDVATWFADSNQSGVSYSSWFEYPCEGADCETPAEADAEAPPAKNSWQLCSAARIIESEVSELGVVALPDPLPAGSRTGIVWKVGSTYTLSNSFSIAGGTPISGTNVSVTVSESGALAKFAAAATALIAAYAF